MKEFVIEAKGIVKRFPKHTQPALDGVDLAIENGQIFGIVGMSGAGKSTLLRLLVGLEEPTEGQLRVAMKRGVIFQHFNLFSSRSALENVMFPLEIKGHASPKERALELLDRVGLKGRQDAYPATLSGGEKQRVAIARALACDPEVLFSDEATSALDPKTTRTILNLLLELNKTIGLTVVLITHQMEVIKEVCTRMAVLSGGRIVEQGNVADIFADPKSAVTKELIKTLSHDIPEDFYPKEAGKELFRLTFRGRAAKEPIISTLIRNYSVEVNILMGAIDRLQEGSVGSLVVELIGEGAEIKKALHYLEERGVGYQELVP